MKVNSKLEVKETPPAVVLRDCRCEAKDLQGAFIYQKTGSTEKIMGSVVQSEYLYCYQSTDICLLTSNIHSNVSVAL